MPLTEEEKKERKRESDKKYYLKNKESLKAMAKKNYTDNREARLECKREYRKKNLEKVKDSQKRCYQRNKKKYYEMSRRWKESNAESQRKYYRDISRLGVKNLSDDYIKQRICDKNSLRFTDIPQSLIKAKRLELQMKRFIKETENV